jgi:serine/threonine protein kinase
MPSVSYNRLFPTANPLALDLLARMLQYDPRNRCTVEHALAHPYLASLHDPHDEPVCPCPFTFGTVSINSARPEIIKASSSTVSFPFPSHAIDNHTRTQDMVFREMMDFHPAHAQELDVMRINGIARALPGFQPPQATLRPIPHYRSMPATTTIVQ